MFNWQAQTADGESVTSGWIWLYFVVDILLTLLVLILWILWTKWSDKRFEDARKERFE